MSNLHGRLVEGFEQYICISPRSQLQVKSWGACRYASFVIVEHAAEREARAARRDKVLSARYQYV